MTISHAEHTIDVQSETELLRYLRLMSGCQAVPILVSPVWVVEQADREADRTQGKLTRKRA